jgi:hypothetical protein
MAHIIIPKYISNLVSEQFPDFYKEEGPTFIAFLKAYYEWMEETDQITNKARNLFEYTDIDETLDAFLLNFQKKYMRGLPVEILGDKRTLQKHILDVYRSKGSVDGLKLLFRLLYNEDVDLYIPSYDILKPSHGKWIEKKYLEISYSENNINFEGSTVTGADSGATAIVERYEERNINNLIVYILFITNILGDFITGELVAYEGLDYSQAPIILGSPNQLTITESVSGFSIGDTIVEVSNNNTIGEGVKYIVSDVRDSTTGIINFTLVDGGFGYSTNAVISIVTGSNTTGSGADFVIGSFTNTSVYVHYDDIIDDQDHILLNANVFAFPANTSANVSTPLEDAFGSTNATVGTIASIITTNPGIDYDGDVSITITDPFTSGALIPDGSGGFWGLDANVTGKAEFGTGLISSIRIFDSGFGYHTQGEEFSLESDSNTSLTVTANVVLNGHGISEGYWKNTDGFLNSDKYVQDSFYYQEFSYEVLSSRSLTAYSTVLKSLVHPTGNELFGRAILKYTDQTTVDVVSSTVTQV